MIGPRIPHFVGRDRVLCIDFAREQVLLAEMNGETVQRHARLRFAGDGSLMRDVPRRGQIQLPDLTANDYVWTSARNAYTVRATIRPELTYAQVDRRDLLKVVDHAHKLSAKSFGREGLMLVTVSADGLQVESLGRMRVRRTFDCKISPRDGLGSCVVLAAALLETLKDLSDPRVQLEYLPRSHTLRVAGRELWTANTTDSHLPAFEGPVVSCKLIPALRRALPFVSTDEARPNLHQAVVTFDETQVKIHATDGHRLYSEVLAAEGASAFASRRYLSLTPLVLKVLTKDKKAKCVSVRAGADEHMWELETEHADFVVRGVPATFPPAETLLKQEWASGLSSLTLAAKTWQAWRDECRAKYKSKDVKGQCVHARFGRASLEMFCHWRTVDKKGNVTEVVQTEPVVIGKDEPRGQLQGLDLVYLWEVLDTFDEDADISIRYDPAPNEGSFFFRQGERVVLLMPVRV